MPAWFWLLLVGLLSAIGAIPSNWLPKPAKLKPRSIVIILAIVTLSLVGIGIRTSSSDTTPSAEKARHEAATSTEAEISYLKNAQELLEPVVNGVNLEQMPSDPKDGAKAREWVDSYNVLYEQFIASIRAIEHYAALSPLEQLFAKGDLESAQQKFLDAATAAKSRSDRLGIECPGTNI